MAMENPIEYYINYIHREKGYLMEDLGKMSGNSLFALYCRIKDYKKSLIEKIMHVTQEYFDPEKYEKLKSLTLNELEIKLRDSYQISFEKQRTNAINDFFADDTRDDFEFLEPDEYATMFGLDGDAIAAVKKGVLVSAANMSEYIDFKREELKKQMIGAIELYIGRNGIKLPSNELGIKSVKSLKLKTYFEVRTMYEGLEARDKSLVPSSQLEQIVLGLRNPGNNSDE